MVTFFGAMQGSITALGPASLVLLPALSRGSSVCRSMFPQSPELGFITQVRWDMCLAYRSDQAPSVAYNAHLTE